MYALSAEQAFDLTRENVTQNHKSPRNVESEKNNSLRKSLLGDFMRYYKTYVYFSIHLAIKIQEELL
jgi:hypothetical protein